MSNPLVSVIIPAYNAEGQIASALETAFDQTYSPIEVIVIDDGSLDNTAEIVKEYQTRRTSLIYTYQENSGPSKARNAGINAATGQYIAFLDADDTWSKDKLEKQIRLFGKDPTIDIVFSDVQILRKKEGKIEEIALFKHHKLDKDFFGHEYLVRNPFEKLLRVNFMLTPSVVTKRSCLRAGFLFDENRKYVEDWQLWLKMSVSFCFGYIRDICVYVRDDGDGLSSNSDSMLVSKLEVMEEALRDSTGYLSLQSIRNIRSECVKDSYKWAGYHFMLKGNNKLARHYYKKSLAEKMDLQTVFYYCRTFINFMRGPRCTPYSIPCIRDH